MDRFRFINDFVEPRRNAQKNISERLEGRGDFSFSYVAQLLSATVVCTLGLITNSTAVIIGGMIIAPLMWPIMDVAYGMTVKKNRISIHPFFMLVASTLVIFIGSALVATLTPYNEITSEMLLRASPTSLEIFIALAAAVIAALAVTHPKISDSVAGVAVATSLVPPLCVSGIGLAYFNFEILSGAFLLFITNTLTIMFVSTFVFSVFVYGRDFTNLKKKEVAAIALALALVSIPLYWRLQDSIVSSSVSNSAKSIVEKKLEEYAPDAELQTYQIQLSSDGDTVSIRALVLLPPSVTISYDEEQDLVETLTRELNKQVDLQLVRQDSLKPITEQEIQELDQKLAIETTLTQELKKLEGTIQINSLSSQLNDDGHWDVDVSVRSPSGIEINSSDISSIEQVVAQAAKRQVTISVEVIQSTIVGSEQSQRQQITKSVLETLESDEVVQGVSNLEIGRLNGVDINISAVLLVKKNVKFTASYRAKLESRIEAILGRRVNLKVSVLEATVY